MATPAVTKLVDSLLRDRKVGSVRKVRAKLRGEGIDLSHGTVHNIARHDGLRSAVPLQKPKLTQEHRAALLAWVEARKDDDEKTIQKLVFADEKSSRSPMLQTVFGCFRRSRHLFVKHVSAFLFLFLLCNTANAADLPSSRCSSSSSPSLHASA